MPLFRPWSGDFVMTELGPTAVHVKYQKQVKQYDAIAVTLPWAAEGKAVRYFEVQVRKKSWVGVVYVGVACEDAFQPHRVPGAYKGSWSFVEGAALFLYSHSNLIQRKPLIKDPAIPHNTLGVGFLTATGELFGTLNGKYMGVLGYHTTKQPLLPCVGFHDNGEVRVEFHPDACLFKRTDLPPSTSIMRPLDHSAFFHRWTKDLLVLLLDGLTETEQHTEKLKLVHASRKISKPFQVQPFYSLTRETPIAQSIQNYVKPGASPVLVCVTLDHLGKAEQTIFTLQGEKITVEAIVECVESRLVKYV